MTNALQNQLGILGELTNELKELDAKLVELCDTMPQAYQMCMSKSKVQRNMDDWADLVGLKTSHFKQIVSTSKTKLPKYMPPEAENALMQHAGNLCPEQWRRAQREGRLNCQRSKDARRAELLAELEALG